MVFSFMFKFLLDATEIFTIGMAVEVYSVSRERLSRGSGTRLGQ